ncbi:MAG: DeoR family transcriptional regulator [Polyangiaceae bacterium]
MAERIVGETAVARLFYEGDYAAVLRETVDAYGGRTDSVDDAFVVGALVFTGRLDEGRDAFDLWCKNTGDARTRVAARFFVVLGLDRAGHQHDAIRWLGDNLRDPSVRRDAWCRFFAHQGVGFHRYFLGHVAGASRAASRALRAAMQANFAYGRLLAADLRGHALVQRGDVRTGLAQLAQAHALAISLGSRGNAAAIQCAIAVYDARHGTSGGDGVASLRKLVEELPATDAYSRRLVLLELALQEALRGERAAAAHSVDQAELSLNPDDRRATVSLLWTRVALAMLGGGRAAGRALLAEARARLDPSVDAMLEVDLLALEWLADTKRADAIVERLRRLHATTGIARATRALECFGDRLAEGASADALGDRTGGALVMASRRTPEAIDRVVDTRLLALLPIALGLAPGRRIHAVRGRLIIECDGAFEDRPPPSRQAWDLLTRLAAGPATKEELLADLWRIRNYSPERHDSVIHTAISRLRHLLGAQGHWIESLGGAYRLSAGVELSVVHAFEGEADGGFGSPIAGPGDTQPSVASGASQVPPPISMPTEHDIRIRSLERMLRAAPEGLATSAIATALGVSDMTALRDLTVLVEKGLAQRVGQGRSTRYIWRGGKEIS